VATSNIGPLRGYQTPTKRDPKMTTKPATRNILRVPASKDLEQEMRDQAAKDGHMHNGRGCIAVYLKALHCIRMKAAGK